MTKFKVGDRVRAVQETAALVRGREYIIARIDGAHPFVDVGGGDVRSYTDEYFEAVIPTLTIQAGRYYKTRDGRKVGPMVARTAYDSDFPWIAELGTPYKGATRNFIFKDNGANYEIRDLDLVAEWVDEPEVAHKFKVGDVVNNDHHDRTVAKLITKYDRPAVEYEYGGWDFERGIKLVRRAEPAAVAPTTAAEPEEPAPYTAPAVGDDVLIPGWITGINHSRKGTVYSIAFETKNRRVSLNFTEDDFIPVDPDDDCPCFAENDNGPLPLAPNTAAAFDDLCGSIFGLTMRAA